MRKIITLTILIFSLYSFGISPKIEYSNLPSDYGLRYIDTSITTSDGASISIWKIDQDSLSNRTFILAYGDAGNKSQLIYHAYYLYNKGYNVIMFDYRGFGGSSFFEFDSLNLYHAEYLIDFQTVVDFTIDSYPKGPLKILSLSMGTIFATHLKLPINATLILDSPVISVKHAQKILKKSIGIKFCIPKLPNNEYPDNVIVFKGSKDMLLTSKQIQNIKAANLVLIHYEGKHLEAMQVFQTKYFNVCDLL